MNRSDELYEFRQLEEFVQSMEPNFEGSSYFVRRDDEVVGRAPDVVGKMIAARCKLKEENKRKDLSEGARAMNMLWLDLLDKYISLHIWKLIPDIAERNRARVCRRGQIFLTRFRAT